MYVCVTRRSHRRTPTVRVFRAAVSWVLISLSLSISACREETPKRLLAVNPSYAGWFALRDSPDDLHTVAVADPYSSRTWYRKAEAGLDLRHFKIAKTHAAEGGNGKFSVFLVVAEPHRELVASWFKEQVGETIGVLLNGQLVYLAPVDAAVRDIVAIPAFSSWDEAYRVVVEIRGGGVGLQVPSKPSTQPAP